MHAQGYRVVARWLATTRAPRLTSRLTPRSRFLSSLTPELRRDGDDLTSWFGEVTPEVHHNYHLLEKAATRWSHHTALECGVTGQSYTYGALQDEWRRCGGAIVRWSRKEERRRREERSMEEERRSVEEETRSGGSRGEGQVVAILMLNSPHFAVVFGGVMAAAAVPSPINPTLTPGEIARQVKNSGANMLVADARLAALAEAAVALLPRPPLLLLAGGTEGGRPDLLAEAADKSTPFADDVEVHNEEGTSVLLYSSGTSGPPKGVPTSHRAIQHNLPAVLHPKVNPLHPTTGEQQETVLGLMPFFHAWGVYTVLNCGLLQGLKVVTLPMFIPDLFLTSLTKHKVGVLHVVPPLLQFLAGHPGVTPDDLASLRVVMCAAAPCPAAAAAALKDKAPNPVFFQEAYGMTETMPTHFTPLGHERLGSCGHLLPGVRARVVDPPSGALLPPNTPGELWVKAPGVMRGYLNNPEATRDTLTSDGWLRTGDVVTCDDLGYFYVVDRIKELIKVKGTQVSPTEIESELHKLAGVADAGVVGVPDDRAGEVPRAYIVRKDPSLTVDEVQAFIGKHLAPHKHLKGGVRFVDELPKNQAGKLLRRKLKELGDN